MILLHTVIEISGVDELAAVGGRRWRHVADDGVDGEGMKTAGWTPVSRRDGRCSLTAATAVSQRTVKISRHRHAWLSTKLLTSEGTLDERMIALIGWIDNTR